MAIIIARECNVIRYYYYYRVIVVGHYFYYYHRRVSEKMRVSRYKRLGRVRTEEYTDTAADNDDDRSTLASQVNVLTLGCVHFMRVCVYA